MKEVEGVYDVQKREYDAVLANLDCLHRETSGEQDQIRKDVTRVKYIAANKSRVVASMNVFKVLSACLMARYHEAFKLTHDYSVFEKDCN